MTAVQVREVVTRLIETGYWRDGDLRILVVFDAGYDVTRLAWRLADLPVELLALLRSDRVMQLPAPPRQPGTAGAPKPGKPGPGRPSGSTNRRPAPRHDVGKTMKRELTLKARRERAG